MRSNKEQSFNINRIGRYAIRKLSIGAVSVLIGIAFAIGGPQIIKADEEPASEQVIKTSNDQEQDDKDNNQSNADTTDIDQDIDIELPDTQDNQAKNQNNLDNKTEDITSADKDNILKIKVEKSATKEQEDSSQLSIVSKKSASDNESKDTEQSLTPVAEDKNTNKERQNTGDKDADTETVSLKSLGKSPKLSADQLFGAKFEVPAISVGNKTEFENAIITAPTDGTEKLIKLINDINLENDLIEIKNGQNIVITNDNQQRKIMIGNQIRVTNGGHLKFQAKQKDGIVITRPTGKNPYNRKLVPSLDGYENYWGVLYTCGQGSELELDNTRVSGFHYIYANAPDLDNIPHNWKENTATVSRTTQNEFQGSLEDQDDHASNSSNDAGLIVISNKATLKMINSAITDNLIYDYADQQNSYTRENPQLEIGTLCIRLNASCTMDKGSEISRNKIGPDDFLSGNRDLQGAISAGGVLILSGHFTANGSTFKDNTGTAGAIYATSYSLFDNSDVNLHSVKVLNNTAYYAGGGIYLEGNSDDLNSKLHATIDGDSIISGNTVGNRNATFSPYELGEHDAANGGGIAVSDNFIGWPSQYDTITRDGRTFKVLKDIWLRAARMVNLVQLTIDGATITNNYATDSGGGMYVNTNGVTIKKATIANNDCHLGMGGGIYVSVAPYSIKLNNAIIYGNSAKKLIDPSTGHPFAPAFDYDDYDATGSGGGVWLCPTGQADIKITKGIAIYNNSADVGGDDLWNELKDPNFHSVISNRVLGGGDANWTHDRDSLDKQKFIGPEIGNDVGLKSHLIKDAKRLAEALAAVKIYGNIAAWGGGVGSNGGVITNHNDHGQDDKNKDITITKHWADADDPQRPKSVTIDVIATYKGSDYLVTSFKLSDKNNWTYQLTGLPTNITYDFVEDATGLDINGDGQADYTESNGKVTFVRTLGDTSYYALTITNTKKTGNTPTPTPGGSQPTEPQPTQPQPSNPQPTLPQPSTPQPTQPQPVHPSKTPKKPKSNITITTNTGKTSSHTPIKSFKSVSHQNKVAQHKIVLTRKQPNKPELPQTGNKKSGMFLTGLGMIILAGLAGAFVNHKRRI